MVPWRLRNCGLNANASGQCLGCTELEGIFARRRAHLSSFCLAHGRRPILVRPRSGFSEHAGSPQFLLVSPPILTAIDSQTKQQLPACVAAADTYRTTTDVHGARGTIRTKHRTRSVRDRQARSPAPGPRCGSTAPSLTRACASCPSCAVRRVPSVHASPRPRAQPHVPCAPPPRLPTGTRGRPTERVHSGRWERRGGSIDADDGAAWCVSRWTRR